jgi:hypothetical protein
MAKTAMAKAPMARIAGDRRRIGGPKARAPIGGIGTLVRRTSRHARADRVRDRAHATVAPDPFAAGRLRTHRRVFAVGAMAASAGAAVLLTMADPIAQCAAVRSSAFRWLTACQQGVSMPREIVGKGLRFSLRHAPCAHICRYCLISESRRRSGLPFSRFEQLVHRFHDWRQAERPDLEIAVFVGPSFDYDIETLMGVARLRERRGAKFRVVNLGGLRIRRGEELIGWLEERRQAGIAGLQTSLGGMERSTTDGMGARGISSISSRC